MLFLRDEKQITRLVLYIDICISANGLAMPHLGAGSDSTFEGNTRDQLVDINLATTFLYLSI
jgi:hypothetical protein